MKQFSRPEGKRLARAIRSTPVGAMPATPAALRCATLFVAIASSLGTAWAAEPCTTEDGTAGQLNEQEVCIADDSTTPPPITPKGALDGGTATGPNAVAIGPNSEALGPQSVAVGSFAGADSNANVAIGFLSQTSGFNSVAIGSRAQATEDFTLSLGGGSAAQAERATAVGTDAFALALNSTALGNGARAQGSFSTANGNEAFARTFDSVAMGSGATAGGVTPEGDLIGASQIAIGSNSNALGSGSVALGAGATVEINSARSMALGQDARVLLSTNSAVALGFGSIADRSNTVSVGSAGAERQIANVAAATTDTDAVNFSQLRNTAATVAEALGGGATGDALGQVSLPTYALDGASFNDVGSALSNIDGRTIANTDGLASLSGDLGAFTTNVTNQFTSVNQTLSDLSAGLDNAALYDGIDRASLTFGGASGTQLRNVAAGDVSQTSTDAINGAQLHATNTQVDQNTSDLLTLEMRADTIDGRVTTLQADLEAGSVGIVRQDPTTGTLSVASTGSGTVISFAGLGGARRLTGVADGAADSDAVNVLQLRTSEQDVRDDLTELVNTSLEGVIRYDGADQAALTLGGTNGTVLQNVAEGEVSATSRQAINGAQLNATNELVAQNASDIVQVSNTVTTLDGRVTTIEGSLDNGTVGLVRQDPGTGVISVAGDKAGTSVNFSGSSGVRILTGVAEGIANDDAVNVGQLRATEQNVRDDLTGLVATSLEGVIRYDGTDQGSLTLGGANGTVLQNVADGELSSTSRQAVNGAQLHATNELVSQNASDIVQVTNNVTALDGRVTTIEGSLDNGTVGLVRQDAVTGAISVAGDKAGTSINFAGSVGDRSLSGVAAGVADNDAVNVGQLRAAEQVIRDDLTGLIGTSLEGTVLYDDTDKSRISFEGTAGTVLSNVAAGEVSAGSREAVNGAQLNATNERVEQTEADVAGLDGRVTTLEESFNSGGIGLVRQDTATGDISVAAATGGTRVSVAGTDGNRVLGGVAAGQADDEAVNVAQLKAAGLIAQDGSVSAALVYDTDAKDTITLGGPDATTAVKVKNVADATEDDEAVNLRQLKEAGLVGESGQPLDAVTYDPGSSRGQITFGGAAGTVLTNVADGRIVVGSSDAVNGGQVAALRDELQGQITNLDNRVTAVEANGGVGSNPYFDANGESAQTPPVGLPPADAQAGGASAVAAGNGAVASGSTSVAVGAGSQASASNSVALGAGSVADRENTVSVGSQGSERQITNVAAGVRDTDAVNVAQLNQRMAEANAYTDQKIDDVWRGVNDRIDSANRQANRGIASASAMIPVTPYMPGKTVLNAGMATYRGESALGIGISRWSDNGRINFNAGVSAAQGDSPIFRIGVGVVLGD